MCVTGSDYCVLEVMRGLRRDGDTAPFRISLRLVAVYCGQFTHLDMKYKRSLMFES